MTEDLGNILKEKLANTSIEGEIVNLEPLTGGASKEIWKFEVNANGKSDRYILRRGSGVEGPLAIKTSDEAKIQKTVRKLGAQVPEIVAVSSLDEELGDAYIMKFVYGESIARKILRDEEYKNTLPKLAFECGQSIAKIHQADINEFPFLPSKTVFEQINDLYQTYVSFNQPSPVFEYTHLWLKKQNFGEINDALVHGDFRLGNIIVDKDGLKSVIDWELAHIGNPLQDLGWICGNSWRFGNTNKVVGGFGDLADLLKGYNSVSNYHVDENMVKAWQVFGTFRWGVICLIQASAHLTGSINSVEKAAIGRRVSETEIDIVDLLFLGGK
ncbi:MAG: phosphotransferase family protein [Gammaproteobacteria bacterium]|jgi:aminoglycoside phosphotransferase (APT) family kinase protein|nr:MAG: phosphotransferase family protein [Gammaproteobacteria bacterium]|tara:strand:+ start:385 stop:1368 length:984 start_codon:yes stop_codon:yes gene_type:complete